MKLKIFKKKWEYFKEYIFLFPLSKICMKYNPLDYRYRLFGAYVNILDLWSTYFLLQFSHQEAS